MGDRLKELRERSQKRKELLAKAVSFSFYQRHRRGLFKSLL